MKGKKTMHVNLSAMKVFVVGEHVDRKSWGERRCRSSVLRRNGQHCALREQKFSSYSSSSRWSSTDFLVSKSNILGRGRFGNVFRATHGTKVIALKRFSKPSILQDWDETQNDKIVILIQNEVFIHSTLRHPNILPFHGFYEDPEHLSLVLSFAPLGDLHDLLERDPRPRIAIASHVAKDVAEAIGYLQRRNIAHRDIKPENILVMSPFHFCLGDFGCACTGYSKDRHTLCGTPEYCPPEMLRKPRRYSAEYVDSWALGVLMFEVVLGKSPFYCESRDDDEGQQGGGCGGDPNAAIFAKILNFSFRGDPMFMPHVWSSEYTTLLKDFCSRLMKLPPQDRMRADDALKHPILKAHQSILSPASKPKTITPQPSSPHKIDKPAVMASPVHHCTTPGYAVLGIQRNE